MPGGIHNVRATDFNLINTESGVIIKTGKEQGNYVKDIIVENAVMNKMKIFVYRFDIIECDDCAGVEGEEATYNVSPQPCDLLPEEKIGEEGCAFPTDRLPIEDVQLQTCSA
ncbi:hypothetical protein QQ045_003779 [Rhodiola kirilowii]